MANRARTLVAPALIALALSTAVGGIAQGQQRGGDQSRDQGRDTAADRERDRDRVHDGVADPDRIADRDRVQDREADRARDRDADRAQDRDVAGAQDRERDMRELHVRDRDALRRRDIYGAELMTRAERNEYRERIREMDDVGEWARYRAEHQERMMARAREQGVDLPPPFYGQRLMTDQERLRLRERLQNATSDAERERIRAEHRELMQERARENRIPLSELE